MVRCDGCGHVQWALLGTPELRDCPACGRQLEAERRHPGRRFLHGRILTERRGTGDRGRDSAR
jgi:ribosomal protein S27E